MSHLTAVLDQLKRLLLQYEFGKCLHRLTSHSNCDGQSGVHRAEIGLVQGGTLNYLSCLAFGETGYPEPGGVGSPSGATIHGIPG